MLAKRYRLERRLAQGGMAEVWLATDTLLSRNVAVKLLKPNLAADPVVAERFRREAIAVARLNHPNIVAVYDSIDEGGRQAVVMQLITGKSLRQLLDDQLKLSADLTMHIGSCVASALDSAHAAGLVHRDVKPGNILITADGRVLLTDFGIAKGLAAAAGDDLTSDNIMMGTAKYLSPEQVRGRKLDGRADLYSLGLVLYECIAGRVPFLGESDAETALARINRDPTDIARLSPALPYGLAELIHRLLARRPDDRFATGAQVRAEIARINSRVDDTTVAFTPPHGRMATVANSSRSTPVVGARAPQAVGGYRPVPGSASGPPTGRTAATSSSSSTPTGSGPVRVGRPAGAPVRVDRTPQTTARPSPQPNRAYHQTNRNSLIVVGTLLIAALVVGLVLWATSGNGNGSAALTSATAVKATPDSATASAAVGPIAALTLFDPDGDGTERSDQVDLARDDNQSTAWTTVCYADRFLGGKSGLGLIADLGQARSGTLSASIGSAPYHVKVLAAPDGPIPASVAAWGSPIGDKADQKAGTITAQVTASRYVAVIFVELGSDPLCRNNRFRGKLSEIHFTPA